MISTGSIITMVVTYICFFLEAMIHYNIGYNSSNPNNTAWIVFPDGHDLMKIIITVGIFSVLCGFLSDYIQKNFSQ